MLLLCLYKLWQCICHLQVSIFLNILSMKKWLWIMCVLGASSGAEAQKKIIKGEQRAVPNAQRKIVDASTTHMQSTRTYAAMANRDTANLFIADPVIQAYNMRSNGANVRLSGSGVIGMPRGSYGFANGQVLLRSTGATSIGGITGSGSVGTGSTPGSPGTSGSALGVNGKNVYAGPSIWGSAHGLNLPDSLLRRRPANQ
jgi:hypothetical protein